MPVKRRASKHRPHLTPDLRPLAERYLTLAEAHGAAILGEAEDLYRDGRFEECIDLGSKVRLALGIRPWEDDRAIIEAALKGAERQ